MGDRGGAAESWLCVAAPLVSIILIFALYGADKRSDLDTYGIMVDWFRTAAVFASPYVIVIFVLLTRPKWGLRLGLVVGIAGTIFIGGYVLLLGVLTAGTRLPGYPLMVMLALAQPGLVTLSWRVLKSA